LRGSTAAEISQGTRAALSRAAVAEAQSSATLSQAAVAEAEEQQEGSRETAIASRCPHRRKTAGAAQSRVAAAVGNHGEPNRRRSRTWTLR
jgi:hypothetical protein